MMEMSLELAKEMYRQDNELMRKLALENYEESELIKPTPPKDWKELNLKTIHTRPKYKTFAKLIQLRDAYNENWKPTIENTKYFIFLNGNKLDTDYSREFRVMSFKNEEIMRIFINNFREELKEVKYLL